MVAQKPWRMQPKPAAEQPPRPSKPQVKEEPIKVKDEKPKKPAYTGPLIPSRTLSFPTQRLLVTAIFFLLQGFKLAGSKTSFNFLLYSLFDALFVYYLPVLAIPRLHFTSVVVFVQCALLILFNYSLFISSAWIPRFFYMGAQSLWALLGVPTSLTRSTNTETAELIRGKYIVNILPEATAALDTIEPLCIDMHSKDNVALRLSVDGTWPSVVKLSRADLGNSDSFTRMQFGANQISKFPSDNKRELFIPVNEPGAYYLDSITDKETGLKVKIHRSRIVIPPCPTAEINLLSNPKMCDGQSLRAEVVVTGLAPLRAQIDGNWYDLGEELPEDAIDSFIVPLEKVGSVDAQRAEVSVSSLFDKIGCSIKRLPETVSAQVVAPPRVIVEPQSVPLVGSGRANAIVKVVGTEGPFDVEFQGPKTNFSVQFQNEGSHNLLVDSLGTYTVSSVKGSLCEGTASGFFEVFSPPPVGANVTFDPIEDHCAGPIGVDAHLKLSGTAPWKVGFVTKKNSRIIHRSEQIFESVESFSKPLEFRPKNVGEFTYEVEYVEDKYSRVDLNPSEEPTLSITQVIKELPGASISGISSTKLCGASKAWVDVLLKGRGPFKLKYRVDDQHESVMTTNNTADTDNVRIDLDLESGTHSVNLVSMTDRNECVIDLSNVRTEEITVRNELPTIAIKNPGSYKSADPVDMKIPLVSNSNPDYPATLAYEHTDDSNEKHVNTIVINSAKDAFLPATSSGTYKLLSFNDALCYGTVGDDEVVISLYDRPKIERAIPDENDNLCEKMGSTVRKFNLVGEAPFIVTHEVVDPTGKSHVSKTKVTNNYFNTELSSAMVGKYTHYLWVTDSQYKIISPNDRLVFSHMVWAPAQARFNTKFARMDICEDSILTEKLPVVLKGEAPFQLTLQIGDDLKVIEVQNPSRFDLRKEIGALSGKTGKVKVKIIEVVDKHGCGAPIPKSGNSFDVHVLPRPDVPQLYKTDYCVGEKVSFPVKGSGSIFNVQYKYNNKKRNVKASLNTHSSSLDIQANEAGNLTLLSISDEKGCSRDTYVNTEIHKLPESTITEEPSFNIYDGDKINLGFAFKGTAPFSFVYIHTVDGKVVERKEIRDVMEDVYNLTVDEGGVYEIIELSDKYCKSVRHNL